MDRDPKESKHPDSLTAYFAHFVASTTYSDIPDDVRQLGKRSILDGLAVALSGSVTSGSRLIQQYLKQLGCPIGSSTVIGTSLELPSRFAALANGTSMHADNFDDTWEAATPNYKGGHPTAPVLAAVLAVAEQEKRTGEEMLAAYHVGVETACRLIDGTDVPVRAHGGRHATGTCGVLAAAAGVCNLRKMSPRSHKAGFRAGRRSGGRIDPKLRDDDQDVPSRPRGRARRRRCGSRVNGVHRVGDRPRRTGRVFSQPKVQAGRGSRLKVDWANRGPSPIGAFD